MSKPLDYYNERLRAVAGQHLLGLAVAAAEMTAADTDSLEPSERVIRSAVVLDSFDLQILCGLAHEGTRLGAQRISAPLVFTPQFLERSRDTFPLELIEIQQQYDSVLGQDYFGPLTFTADDVRLQCERELKVIAVGMHQGLLVTHGREREIEKLSLDYASQLVRTLRGLLWLKDQRQRRGARDIVRAAENSFDRPLTGVWAALGATEGTPWQRFYDLYADVQLLGQAADAM